MHNCIIMNCTDIAQYAILYGHGEWYAAATSEEHKQLVCLEHTSMHNCLLAVPKSLLRPQWRVRDTPSKSL